ncbi:MAG TPA: ABC transporter permease [Candidatus Limnocylindria bacterium]|jgi:tungstate transport system permease protein|nr:ABC transporter permease [Candidatus Limnocylindria bacterium]
MDLILQGLGEAVSRLVSLDSEVREATSAALVVSGVATLASVATGVPAGAWLGLARFRGRELLLSLVNTGMGLPPVVVGLFVAVLVWRSGPLGNLDWYCTRQAMIVAQYLLAAPTVVGLTAIAIQSVDPMLRVQLAALGATRRQTLGILVREARLPILTAAMAGFGAVISEIGASLMVGCNIKGDTRILTTAIALDTSKGEFGSAFALAFILLLLVFAVNAVTTWAQQRRRPL